nr:transporter [uncultured bacterium]
MVFAFLHPATGQSVRITRNQKTPPMSENAHYVVSSPSLGESARDATPDPAAVLWRHRGFLRLLAGSMFSLLGDQFTMVAIAWLVFKLTGSGAALGTVLALVGLPRVALVLFAGVLVDRHSPRRILIGASVAGAVILAALGASVLTETVSLYGLYVFALLMGLVGTCTGPARMAMAPRVVEDRLLPQANAILMGVTQLSVLLGPVLAGVLISTSAGLGLAFLVDSACFLLVALTVPALTCRPVNGQGEEAPMLSSILQGLRWLWNDRLLRWLIVYWTIAVFLAGGIVQVGLPILVKQQLQMDSAAFGFLISANGFGQLLGMLLSGVTAKKALPLGIVVCLIDFAAGMVLMGVGLSQTLVVDLGLVFALGIGAGLVEVRLFTWIQQRIPSEMMGRVISIMTLLMATVAPLSALIAGASTRWLSIGELFVGGGLALSAFALLSLSSPALRSITSDGRQADAS